ncbi:ABC transporter permease [Xylanimonas oleitrophica]|uniref:Transport permease protein n=1 Tax=Xylanimonas oleitrophica TaxID=2607479 RepID=A0A2W5XRN8_9MICO|nr:ABC transporter permease [Xylanimonas oleitrophica]PZR52358.1 ABC transporter permease [Xylanimonas oleitrophica]
MTASTTTASTRTAPSRAPRVVGLRGFPTLLAVEARVWLREVGTVFFALAFPTVLLVGVGFAIPGMRDVLPAEAFGPEWEGRRMLDAYVPAVLAVAVATPALTTMPVGFATFRERGVLRRLSTTPMRPQGIVLAHLVINLAATVVATLLALAVAIPLLGVVAPANVAVVLLGFLLAVVAMYAIGTLVAARAPRAGTASAIGSLVYFPMMFFAGLWTPGPIMPDTVERVAQLTPLGAAAQMMGAGWQGEPFPALQLVVLLLWTAVCLPLGVRLFRWT